MKTVTFLSLLVLFSGCRSRVERASVAKAEFGPAGVPVDWGNLQPLSGNPQTTEAKMANAAARRLNEASRIQDLLSGLPKGSKALDGVAAIPVKFLTNDKELGNQPFGDGQVNSSVGWIGWPPQNSDVPMVMSLIQVANGKSEFRLLVIEPSASMIQMFMGSGDPVVTGELSDSSGDKVVFGFVKDPVRRVYRAVLTIGISAKDMGGTSSYQAAVTEGPKWLAVLYDLFAQPKIKFRFVTKERLGEQLAWPVSFRFPVQPHSQALAALPSKDPRLPVSGNSIDSPPYRDAKNKLPVEALKIWRDGQGENEKESLFFGGFPGVHNKFIDGGGKTNETATGGVDTYVIKKEFDQTQVLYTCFDARNPAQEVQLRVPSGAGWHSIGHETKEDKSRWTFGETVLNTFENTGIFAAWGAVAPYPFSQETPFEAKDIATYRVLRPGEAYTTLKSNFHWYAVDASRKICAVVWKHLACELVSDKNYSCKK